MGGFKEKTLNDQRIIKNTKRKSADPMTISMSSFAAGTVLILVCSFLNGSDIVPHGIITLGLVLGTIMDIFAAVMFYEIKKLGTKGMGAQSVKTMPENSRSKQGTKKKKR